MNKDLDIIKTYTSCIELIENKEFIISSYSDLISILDKNENVIVLFDTIDEIYAWLHGYYTIKKYV